MFFEWFYRYPTLSHIISASIFFSLSIVFILAPFSLHADDTGGASAPASIPAYCIEHLSPSSLDERLTRLELLVHDFHRSHAASLISGNIQSELRDIAREHQARVRNSILCP